MVFVENRGKVMSFKIKGRIGAYTALRVININQSNHFMRIMCLNHVVEYERGLNLEINFNFTNETCSHD